MDSFEIVFQASVHKDLRRLPATVIGRVMGRIENLATDPWPAQGIKLSGAERLYRIRVGDYRIVYEVDGEARRVTIHYVRHRRDVYRAI
jgi:mRNA interferase RelE/StbE